MSTEEGRAAGILEGNHEVTRVLPELLLSSIDVALDRGLLEEHGVKRVLSLGLLDVPRFPGIAYHHLRMQDLPRFDIGSHLETALALIEEAKRQAETVLVHCRAGRSRSAAVVIAYLMRSNRWPYAQAHDFLKRLRPSIDPNPGFIKQLIKYEDNLKNNLSIN